MLGEGKLSDRQYVGCGSESWAVCRNKEVRYGKHMRLVPQTSFTA